MISGQRIIFYFLFIRYGARACHNPTAVFTVLYAGSGQRSSRPLPSTCFALGISVVQIDFLLAVQVVLDGINRRLLGFKRMGHKLQVLAT